jgi:hypothetical protein
MPKASSRENSASFTRSVVGRVSEPGTFTSGVPPAAPAMIRLTAVPLQAG